MDVDLSVLLCVVKLVCAEMLDICGPRDEELSVSSTNRQTH